MTLSPFLKLNSPSQLLGIAESGDNKTYNTNAVAKRENTPEGM